jgi:5-methylcytosine-specific restriction endonuclease McrBC GTP-binding regulatory subunit McrB
MARYNELKSKNRIIFTTFHQSYGYEEFIEGIKPIVDSDNNEIGYTIESGIFKKFCENARKSEEIDGVPYVFIIDEINRGNISKIFGELITLIEDTKRDGMPEAVSAILPYSGKTFSIPSNVYILGTMNTADRSIALMDTALRRRFQFVEMMPNSDVIRKIHADKVIVGNDVLDVAAMLDTINERITFLYDREHTIGHSFFIGLATNPSIDNLAGIFSKSIIPLLQEYFYEDYQKIQLVLGDNSKTEESLKFIKDTKVVAKNIFKGSMDDIVDLPEKKYEINYEAFTNILSYIEIM